MAGNHGKTLTRRARRNVLADGQGARKKKAAHTRVGSKRHKRSFRDITRARGAATEGSH